MPMLTINGKAHDVDVAPDMPLLWVLRDVVGLTGTKFGCGVSACGACTVHLDGQPIRSCITPVAAGIGRQITTIEAIGETPAGRGPGVSLFHSEWDTYMAQVAEVEVSKSGELRVHRVVCAVDCGTVINPDTVTAQIECGINFGISAALWGEITLENGRVEQSNFTDYRVLRINEAQAIEVHLVQSGEAPGRIGEPGTAAIAPALANAVFAVTGKRSRQLPVRLSAA